MGDAPEKGSQDDFLCICIEKLWRDRDHLVAFVKMEFPGQGNGHIRQEFSEKSPYTSGVDIVEQCYLNFNVQELLERF